MDTLSCASTEATGTQCLRTSCVLPPWRAVSVRLRPYTCPLLATVAPPIKGCFHLLHHTLERLAQQPSSAAWAAVARALAGVLLPDLEARLQWLQEAENQQGVGDAQCGGVLRGSYLYRAFTVWLPKHMDCHRLCANKTQHQVPRTSTHDHSERSRESFVRLLVDVLVGPDPHTGQAATAAATARDLLQGLLRLTGRILCYCGISVAPTHRRARVAGPVHGHPHQRQQPPAGH